MLWHHRNLPVGVLLVLHSDKSQLVSSWLCRGRSRKEEIRSLTANDFTEFYGRVKGIKDFHRKHPNEVACSSITGV